MDISPPKRSNVTHDVTHGERANETVDFRDTFGALRQLSKEVHEILVVHNRELNQAAMWALGRWWSEDAPRRPNIARTFRVSGRPKVSGVLTSAYRSTRG